jgi:transaldolase
MGTFMNALEARLARGDPIDGARSVASFFLSRIDTQVDERLDRLLPRAGADERPRTLRGRAATAWAAYALRVHKQVFAEDRWERLRQHGALVQKPLWASMSTKDPSYRDVKYPEALVQPGTIVTMPRVTLDAFRNHGSVRPSLEGSEREAMRVLKDLHELGIDMERVADELLEDGIVKFTKPYVEALEAIEHERRAFAASGVLGSVED